MGSVAAGEPLGQAEQAGGGDPLGRKELIGVIGVEGDELARRGGLDQGVWSDLARFRDEQVGELVGVIEDPGSPPAQLAGSAIGSQVAPRDLRRAQVLGHGMHAVGVVDRDRSERLAAGGSADVQGRGWRRVHGVFLLL